MKRLEEVRAYVESVLASVQDAGQRGRAAAHLEAVSEACVRIAAARSLDAEPAAASGLLHDIYRYRTGIASWHAHSGAEMARPWMRDTGGFSVDEQTLILSAIHHHSDLAHLHDAYDELLKGAVVLAPYLTGSECPVSARVLPRLGRVSRELGLSIRPIARAGAEVPVHPATFSPLDLADIAESLAGNGIEGTRTDSRFAEILRYWPEESAYDELVSNWCAAFVYHCCLKAGLALPIRHPLVSCRFAAVAAWFSWASLLDCCCWDRADFSPCRGDILIYNDVIPAGNKPEGGSWHDHLGIVLSCEDGVLRVAEGNRDNLNRSAIVERQREEHLGCYVRIPAGTDYDGWRYDYKTHALREHGYTAVE